MLRLEYPNELLQHIGRELGPSEWITVDQAMIDRFADATSDHQWIYVDLERARREMPGGKTIAHGYLTLALVPRRAATLLEATRRTRGSNYGSYKIRFTSSGPAAWRPAGGDRKDGLHRPQLHRPRARGRPGASQGAAALHQGVERDLRTRRSHRAPARRDEA